MNKKLKTVVNRIAILLIAGAISSAYAATGIIKERAADHTGGRLGGGAIGFLLGGFGGPLGSLAGGAIGAWAGQGLQQATDNSGTRYRVVDEQGRSQWLRSTDNSLAIGDSVRIDGARLEPLPAR